MLMDSLNRLRKASHGLAALADDELLDGLEAALNLWLGSDGYAARAARELASLSGASEDMLRFGLDRAVHAHRRDELHRWLVGDRKLAATVAREASVRGAEGAPDERRDFDRGPELVTQVLAGNVAGLALPAALEALLARSAVVLKPAAGDPVTAPLFKKSLDKAAPILGDAVAVRTWKGGDADTEAEVFGGSDLVVASGGAEMVDALQYRVKRPLILHGPRFSVGVVGGSWRDAPDYWWDETAREIALWDQEGCLSPRILFVAGARAVFARRLAEALARWDARWPARPRTPGLAAEIHAYRARYEMGDGRRSGLVAPGDTAWTVVFDDEPSLEAGPPARVVRVAPRLTGGPLKKLLSAHRGEIQGVGVDHLGRNEEAIRQAAHQGGVPFTARLTAIQDPPAGWRADGRSGLALLLAQGREPKAVDRSAASR